MTGKDPVRANHIRPVKIYTPYTFRDPEHATGWFSSSSFIIRALRSGIKRKGRSTHTKVSDAFNVSQESDYNLADGGGKSRPQSTHPLAAVSLPFKN
jgi:hypothetical protein